MRGLLALEEEVLDPPMPLLDHLAELRRRLIVSLLILGLGAAAVFRFSGDLLSWLARPAGGLVFVAPAEAFYTRLQVALFGGFLLTLPFLLHQAWLFVARALDGRWRRVAMLLAPLSYLLFIAGAALAVFLVVPAALRFLLSYGSEGVRPLLSLSAYLEFVTGLSLAFGIVFQLPLALFALNRAGVVERGRLRGLRGPIYVACFAAAALLTPGPDVVTQLLLGLPAVLLFELSLLAMG